MSRERGILCHNVIDALRGYSVIYFGTPKFGLHLDEILMGFCVIIGQTECRTMSATDIAGYTGIPRATVVRKMKKLVAIGHLTSAKNGRRTQYAVTRAGDPDVTAELAKIISRLQKKWIDISRLDDTNIDRSMPSN